MPTQPFLFTDDMGEISGFGKDNRAYEAACRRMVIAGAEWITQHPAADIKFKKVSLGEGIVVTGNWERVFEAETPETHALFDTIHRACCADQGDHAGPSALMLGACLDQVQYVRRHGWDTYVEERRALAREKRR